MPRVVVITGMHRSGTSLAASLLARAGLNIGDTLLEASRANPRGFFEDADFVEFHKQILRDRGRTILVDEGFSFEPSQAEHDRAAQLVAARSDKALWGWKDPRTSLFLDFWDSRLDEATYLFLFRHPLDVLLSLLRRGESDALGLTSGIRAWETYNRRILEFHAGRSERCALVHADGLSMLDPLNDVLRRRLGVDIAVTPEILTQLYRPAELHSSDDWARASFALVEPGAAAVYGDLVRAADVVPPDPPPSDEPPELAAFRASARDFLPHLRMHRRGLLLTLLELVSPDTVEAAIELQRAWIAELEEAKEWLDEQRFAWKAIADDLERRRLKSRIARLTGRLRRPE
jgi:O-antigen biosynthesis protein